MTLLIDSDSPGWMSNVQIREELAPLMAGQKVVTYEEMDRPEDVTMLAVTGLRADLPARLPNLKLIQRLGAGVEAILAHPELPDHVRITRLKPELPAREIAEFFLTYVLAEQRHLRQHRADQTRAHWAPVAPAITQKTTVAVLGLGHIGGYTARLFSQLGFNVLGWARSPKTLDGVTCYHGRVGLHSVLAQANYVAAILPSTNETRGLFDAAMFARMKKGATFLNAGRGDLVDEGALIAALDKGLLAHAVLDVLFKEPLPADNPLWHHPAVTITPHVSGWHLGDAMKDVAANYLHLSNGRPLLHEVDRKLGY